VSGDVDDMTGNYVYKLTGLIDAMQGSTAVGNQDDGSGKPEGGEGGRPPMPPQAVDAVGRRLKASYDRMLREPIPDKLIQLLENLERSQANKTHSDDELTHSDDELQPDTHDRPVQREE